MPDNTAKEGLAPDDDLVADYLLDNKTFTVASLRLHLNVNTNENRVSTNAVERMLVDLSRSDCLDYHGKQSEGRLYQRREDVTREDIQENLDDWYRDNKLSRNKVRNLKHGY